MPTIPVVALAVAVALVMVSAIAVVPCPTPRRPIVRATHRRPGDGDALQLADHPPTPSPLARSWRAVISVAAFVDGPRRARRRRREIDAALPDVIELVVLVVRAGASPTQAVHEVTPLLPPSIRPAFDDVAHRLHRGRRLADAVAALPQHLGHRATVLADAIATADRYGLPLGPVLDALTDEARDHRRRVGEAHARSLSVTLSFPLVTCTLPAFVLIAIVPAVLGSLASLPTSPIRP